MVGDMACRDDRDVVGEDGTEPISGEDILDWFQGLLRPWGIESDAPPMCEGLSVRRLRSVFVLPTA